MLKNREDVIKLIRSDVKMMEIIKAASILNLPTILGEMFWYRTLWVFHFTYGKFPLYALCKLILDLLFTYPFNALFQKIGLYKLKRFNSTILFLISYSPALLNYGFQKAIEKPNSLEELSNNPVIIQNKKTLTNNDHSTFVSVFIRRRCGGSDFPFAKLSLENRPFCSTFEP